MSNLTPATPKVETIIKELDREFFGRGQEIRLGILGILTEEPVLFYGPPGTAKSMLARRLAECIEKPQCNKVEPYFETLLSNYSQPEQIVGPIDIAELKNGTYKHKTEGYLPNARVAFLDELFRVSNGGILDTLLTLVNEKKFHNGKERINVPLKALFAACNDLPDQSSAHGAMLDRFLIRCPVHSVVKNFQSLGVMRKLGKHCSNQITTLSDHYIDEIHKAPPLKYGKGCGLLIEEIMKEKEWEISDRRWKKASNILSIAAIINGRKKIHLWDMFLLPWLLASNEEQFNFCQKLIEDTLFMDDKGFKKHLKNTAQLKEIYENCTRLLSCKKGTIFLTGKEVRRIQEKAQKRKEDWEQANEGEGV